MITVYYKCSCMQDEGSLQIKSRPESEDIRDFMDRVQLAISQDHHHRNALCRATVMEYAKIPVGKTGAGIGAKP